MEIVKKNIVSIVCGVVALLALVYYLVGVSPKYSALEEKMKAETSKPDEIRKIMQAPRTLPQVTDGPARPLTIFPNQKVIDQGRGLVKDLGDKASALVSEAVRINHGEPGPKEPARAPTRSLLVERSLPRPDPQSEAYRFRDQYSKILTRGARTASGQVSLPDALVSVEPPTEAEISKAKTDLWYQKYVPQLEIRDGQPLNLTEVSADYQRAIKDYDEDYRRKRAMNYKIYLDPGALAMAPGINVPQAPAVSDIWFAQVSLWIQQDVCRAISAMNQDSRSIPTSPVKHLISVEIPQGITMYVQKGGTQSAPAATPGTDTGTTAAPAGPVVEIDVKDYTLSPTGRVCNRLYDVVQFYVTAVVDAKAVKPFIQQLQYNQFINVLETDIQGVDLDQSLDEGYEYGKRPVVEVRMRCEALFLRDWTAWIPPKKGADGQPIGKPMQGPMPIEVQKMLNIPSPLAQPQQPQDTTATPS